MAQNNLFCMYFSFIRYSYFFYFYAFVDQNIVQQNSKLPFATCRNFGPYSFRTFDGLLYDFAGNCKYTMAMNGRQWNIDIAMHNCNKLETCRKVTRLFYNIEKYIFLS